MRHLLSNEPAEVWGVCVCTDSDSVGLVVVLRISQLLTYDGILSHPGKNSHSQQLIKLAQLFSVFLFYFLFLYLQVILMI